MPTAKKPSTPTKKTAAKSPPTKTPAAAAGEGAETAAPFALSALAGELGVPDAALIAALLQETPDAELLERGTQISSERVVTDAARMLGIAWTFYKGASADQRRLLRGCSQDLLALSVAETLRLEQLLDQQEAQRQHESGQREASAAAENTAWDTALGLRNQAEEVLRSAAGSRATRAAVTEAVGNAETGAALARGLEALAQLLESWLQQGAGTAPSDQALKLRLALFALDADYAQELRHAAESLRQKAATAQNRPQTARVSQAQLDRQDGLCLLLLDRVMRAFERGHALEPTIPRLIPRSARSVLLRLRSTPKSEPTAPTPTPV